VSARPRSEPPGLHQHRHGTGAPRLRATTRLAKLAPSLCPHLTSQRIPHDPGQMPRAESGMAGGWVPGTAARSPSPAGHDGEDTSTGELCRWLAPKAPRSNQSAFREERKEELLAGCMGGTHGQDSLSQNPTQRPEGLVRLLAAQPSLRWDETHAVLLQGLPSRSQTPALSFL